MNNIGLVLEGGGMRGLYTAGVLEFFLEKQLFFPYVIGVSAGACMAASYLSRQKGRNKEVNIGLANDPRYLSYRNLLMKKQLFGMDFLFDEIPKNIVPFDFETFYNKEERFVVGVTDCQAGEAIYYSGEEHDKNILTIVRASSSIPFLAPPVNYDGKILLDGGIAAPIPLLRAKEDGMKKSVVVLTKTEDYKKSASRFSIILKYFSATYPRLGDLLVKRYAIYNETLQLLEQERNKGTVFIIQPTKELPVSRIERKQHRLEMLYQLGYADAKETYTALKQWMIT